MKDVYNIGMHVSVAEVYREIDYITKNFDTIQIFVGSPRTFNINPDTVEMIKDLGTKFKIIVHSPYIVNICNMEHKTYIQTLDFMRQVAKIPNLYGYVTHIGNTHKKEEEPKDRLYYIKSMQRAIKTILPDFERNQTMLFVENDSGNKHGTNIGDMSTLLGLVRGVANKWFKLCWDTEHAFARGDVKITTDLGQIGSLVYIGMIHLNSIETGVEYGNFLDRHSKTTFDICTTFSVDEYKEFAQKYDEIPKIFEVGSNIERGVLNSTLLRDE